AAEAGAGDSGKSGGLVRSGDRLGTQEVFEFVSAHQDRYPVATMCRVLGVSTSGYYAWRKRPVSERAETDRQLKIQIHQIHKRRRGSYGAPRVHAELIARAWRIGRKRVARLMREEGLEGISRRRRRQTTRRQAGARRAPDLVDRNFTVQRP